MAATKSTQEAAAVWDRCHNVGTCSDGSPATNLYTDNDPATTIKGCGFKNAAVAELTIKLATQPGSRYKSYWTIRAMRERAERHPHLNDNMREAIAIFDAWLKQDNIGKTSAKEMDAEREQRSMLAKSFANAHARSRCDSDQEFAAHTRADKNDALRVIRDQAALYLRGLSKKGSTVKSFALKATSFVAMFGGPGEHGYGTHTCNSAQAQNLEKYRCVCGYHGVHCIQVVRESRDLLQLGAHFPFGTFTLGWDGIAQEACFLTAENVQNGGCSKRGLKVPTALQKIEQAAGKPGTVRRWEQSSISAFLQQSVSASDDFESQSSKRFKATGR